MLCGNELVFYLIGQNFCNVQLWKAGRSGQMGSVSECQAGSLQFKSLHPTSTETCMWGRQLAILVKVLHHRGISRECISHTPPPSANEAAHSGFETQRRCHQNSKTGVLVAPQMYMCPTKNISFVKLKISR